MKHTEKNPRNGRLPNIEFGAMSRQGLENILSCPFSYFWALSKPKNNIKQLKNIEKQ